MNFNDTYRTTNEDDSMPSWMDDPFAEAGEPDLSPGMDEAPVYRSVQVQAGAFQHHFEAEQQELYSFGEDFDAGLEHDFSGFSLNELQKPPMLHTTNSLVPDPTTTFGSGAQPSNPTSWRVLKLAPSCLAPYTTFTSATPAVRVWDSLLSCLNDCRADCEIKQNKYKLKGVTFEGASAAHFCVRMYRHQSNSKEVVVEFQKDNGCVMVFGGLYRQVHQKLRQDGIILESGRTPTNSPVTSPSHHTHDSAFISIGAAPPPPPPLATEGETEDEPSVESVLGNLLEMATCTGMRDQRLQAVSSLVSLSKTCPLQMLHVATIAPNTPIAPPANLVQLLSTLLCSAEEDLLRCGSMILDNLLSASANLDHAVLSPLLRSMFDVLTLPSNTLTTTDTKRHIAASIAKLAQCHPTHLSHSPDYMGCLHKYERVADPALRSSIQATLSALS